MLQGQSPKCPGDEFDGAPRSGHLSWDDYFMALAFLSAQRSKDPNKQVCKALSAQAMQGYAFLGLFFMLAAACVAVKRTLCAAM